MGALTINQLDRLAAAIADLRIANDQGLTGSIAQCLGNLIDQGESCMIAARSLMATITSDTLYDGNTMAMDMAIYGDNLPCQVVYDRDAFIVKSPLTIKRGDSSSKKVLQENYQLAQYVHAAIKKWQLSNPKTELWHHPNFIGGDLIFIIIRKAITYNRNVLCDNDNLENGKIQNEICRALGIGDDCRVLDLYSCFRFAKGEDDVGTEFILTKRKNLQNYI